MNKKKIVILGPKDGDKARIKNEYGKIFKLSIHSSKVGAALLRRNVVNADEIIIMTDHISHNAHEVVKINYPHKPILIPGGYTSLKSILNGLI